MQRVPKVGDSVQALDEDTGLWIGAAVQDRDPRARKVLLHFDGWSTQWNQWISAAFTRSPKPQRLLSRRQPRETLPPSSSQRLKRGDSIFFKVKQEVHQGLVCVNDPFLGEVTLRDDHRISYEDLVSQEWGLSNIRLPGRVTVQADFHAPEQADKQTAPVKQAKRKREEKGAGLRPQKRTNKQRNPMTIITLAQPNRTTTPTLPTMAPTTPTLPTMAPTTPTLPTMAPTTPTLPTMAPTTPTLPTMAPTTPTFPTMAPTMAPTTPTLAPTTPTPSTLFPTTPTLPTLDPTTPTIPTLALPAVPNPYPMFFTQYPLINTAHSPWSMFMPPQPYYMPPPSTTQFPPATESASPVSSPCTPPLPSWLSSSSYSSSSPSLPPSSPSLSLPSPSPPPSLPSPPTPPSLPSPSLPPSLPSSSPPPSLPSPSPPPSLPSPSPPRSLPSPSPPPSLPSPSPPPSLPSPSPPPSLPSPLSQSLPSPSPPSLTTSPTSSAAPSLPESTTSDTDRIKKLEEEVAYLKRTVNALQSHLDIREPTRRIYTPVFWQLRPSDIPEFISDEHIQRAYQRRNDVTLQETLDMCTALSQSRGQLTRELFYRTFTLGEVYCRNVRGIHRVGEKRPCRGPFDPDKVKFILDSVMKRYPTANPIAEQRKCICTINSANRYLWNKRLNGITFPTN